MLSKYQVISHTNFDNVYFPTAEEVQKLSESDWIPNKKKPKWLGFCHQNKPYKLEEVEISKILQFTIFSKIEKVKNPYLKRAFKLKKSQSDFSTISVFHGTRYQYMIPIIENNFNWRYSGRMRGFLFGRGVYFSPDIDFTYQFCTGSVDEHRIIQSKILYKKMNIGSEGDPLPQQGCDTTKSPDGTILVKFEDSDYLPTYVIHIDLRFLNFRDQVLANTLNNFMNIQTNSR